MEKQREIITIAIYRETHQKLMENMRKDEIFKDKFEEIVNQYVESKKRRRGR